VHARVADTSFRSSLALFSIGSAWAHAEEVLEEIDTGGVVLARLLDRAHGHLLLTTFASPSVGARALVGSDAISAHASVETGRSLAVIDVIVAGFAVVSVAADARELVVQVQAAFCSSWVAWVVQTLVNLGFALQTNESRSALACESIKLIDARGSILARVACAIVDGVLAVLSGVASVAVALVAVDHVNADSVVFARFNRTVVDVLVARLASPSGMTDALVLEEPVDTNSVLARLRHAQVDLLLASLSGESWWTCADKVVDQVSAVGTQQARILSTVVGVDLALLAFPARRAVALESSLLQGSALSSVSTRISVRCAWVDCHVAVASGGAATAEASVVSDAGLVFAHGTSGTGVVAAVGLFFLAVDAGVSWSALALVALRQIFAHAVVVARLRCALVDVGFAASSSESSWAEALNAVSHGHAKTTVLTSVFTASNRFAFFTAG
jgi:hypothetical protein